MIELLFLAASLFEIRGQVFPEARAAVSLHGATTPFSDSTLSDGRGRFRFRKLSAGSYTLVVYVPGSGEGRQTVAVGPGTADKRGRVEASIRVSSEVHGRGTVSVRQLAVADRARGEYENARKKLSRRDVTGAVEHLERAVEISPQFAEAWNYLGTIAYQSGDYARAEGLFRKALDQDAEAFEPLVNLGGALLSQGKFEEAMRYNQYASLARPNDALANSQLGMNHFYLGRLGPGQKHLEIAKKIDPAHFSHPQLILAEIHLKRKDTRAAIAEMEHFLKHHPDAPNAAKVREEMERLKRRE
ncbi:MAG: tetratricopeptide repeat protein [Bryobacteraceae bacterium]